MFAAGLLMWANTLDTGRIFEDADIQYYGFGWPLPAVFVPDGERLLTRTFSNVYYPTFTIDLIIAIVFLFSVWYMCESLIRRRALKKGP